MSDRSEKMSGVDSKIRTGEFELTERFLDQMAKLCLNDDYSDVTFIVENQRLPAHRVVLAARSEYFRALLYGGLSETNQTEVQLEIPLEAFKALLRYIYSCNISLSQMKEEDILETLGLANQYGFTELELPISDYLQQVLSLNNVCAILDAARLHNAKTLTNVCYAFMDHNASEIVTHSSFKDLSQESLEVVLRRDSFFASENDVFLAVNEWRKHNPNVDIERIVSHVRLPLMDFDHLFGIVRESGIVELTKLLDVIKEKTTSKCLPYRGALWPEENVASSKFNSQTIQGQHGSELLDGDTKSYKVSRGYARHSIDNSNQGIVVELGTVTIINHIKILLWDRDSRSYSYYIEVSVDQEQWECVVDYRTYMCRSWQFLYFPARPVRYIKLVGTHNTVNKVFHAVALEAMHTAKVPTLVDGIVAPTDNVATPAMSATVIEGSSPNNLLSGDYTHYDWAYGYTYHDLGNGAVVIRLGQPYYIDSLRLLLLDIDERTYCLYIETSNNQKDWETIVDRRTDSVRSWQNFSFTPRPVTFIKITGTQSINSRFHCVHFECPSQDQNFIKLERSKENVKIEQING